MNTGTWKWLPIEQAPKDRPILVVGGTMESELDWTCDCVEPTKVCFTPDGYRNPVTDKRDGSWNVQDTCYYCVWVLNPTHFCELPTPPEVG